ncbi:MAG: PspC domain-containing protein, partial [Actinomycetota bacterium]
MYRLVDQKKWAGVAAGIGWYFGVDPVLIRIGFVVLGFMAGPVSLGLYVLLWIFLPEATSQRVPMSAPKPAGGRSRGVTAAAIVLGAMIFGQIDLFRGDVLLAAALIGLGVLLFNDRREVPTNPFWSGGPSTPPPPAPWAVPTADSSTGSPTPPSPTMPPPPRPEEVLMGAVRDIDTAFPRQAAFQALKALGGRGTFIMQPPPTAISLEVPRESRGAAATTVYTSAYPGLHVGLTAVRGRRGQGQTLWPQDRNDRVPRQAAFQALKALGGPRHLRHAAATNSLEKRCTGTQGPRSNAVAP